MKLEYCVVGILACNLAWSYFQERVGATKYCNVDGGDCEKFKSIPVMSILQALAASVVGYICLVVTGGKLPSFWRSGPAKTKSKDEDGEVLTLMDFFVPSLCHTIASPVGYAAMRFIPYPFYMCVSTAKFLPVLLVGWLVNGKVPDAAAGVASAIMMQGILLYSHEQLAQTSLIPVVAGSASAGAGGHGHGPASFEAVTLFGYTLTPAVQIMVGILVTLINLSMEGYTSAGQDALRKRAGRKSGATYNFVLMCVMNAWNVVLLGVFLAAEAAYVGASSFLLSGLAFAQRHPELIGHISAFAALGAIAQIFIFSSIASHGTFTTTTITVSRKFLSVLISVVVFGHKLSFPQWVGVLDVFTGLAVQLRYGGHGHSSHAVEDKKAAEVKKIH